LKEGIQEIVWRVDGKVKKVIFTSESEKNNLEFDYDAFGRRIAKHVLTQGNILVKSTYYILDAQGNQLSTYEHVVEDEESNYQLSERVMYGSSRLGINVNKVDLFGNSEEDYLNLTLGNKLFEMSNHLGNVLTVINDIKVPYLDGSDVAYYATIVSTADYSPFGVQLDGRTVSAEEYRYGYQGSEKDDEVKGSGNSYTTEFRMLDPRLGRWLSIDPLAGMFPWQSPYVSMDNNPIWMNDVSGLSTDGGDDCEEDFGCVVKGETTVVFNRTDAEAAKAANNVLSTDGANGSAIQWIDKVKSGKEDYSFMKTYRSYDPSTGMNTGPITYQGERMVNMIEHLAVIERRDLELYDAMMNMLGACQTHEEFLLAYGLIETLSVNLRLQTPIMVLGTIGQYAEFIAEMYVLAILGPAAAEVILARIGLSLEAALAYRTVVMTERGAAVATTTIRFTNHCLLRMAQRGITKDMALVAIKNGKKYYDPVTKTINYIMPNAFASGKSLLVGTSPLTGEVTTVIRSSKNLVNKRFIPIK
jgi:RHS repeat-associated protein